MRYNFFDIKGKVEDETEGLKIYLNTIIVYIIDGVIDDIEDKNINNVVFFDVVNNFNIVFTVDVKKNISILIIINIDNIGGLEEINKCIRVYRNSFSVRIRVFFVIFKCSFFKTSFC